MQNVKWFLVPRASLPDTIHGFVPPRDEVTQPRSTNADFDGITIAFPYAPSPSSTQAVLGLVDAAKAPDLFSWLSTFAPEAFPISQSFRILTLTDWEEGVSALTPRAQVPKDPIWPSLILGEILGQGERENDIASIPLSRVFAAFTYAQARANLLYDSSPNLIDQCRQRLLLLESDASFVKRPIGVRELAALWDLANDTGDSQYREIIGFVAGTLASGNNERPAAFPSFFAQLGVSAEKLASDSTEQRVLEFERVIGQLKHHGHGDAKVSLTLAALAMLVGRSTTHITLLDEYLDEHPTAIGWFGLLAGRVGPEVWDEKWMRLSTSIERLLRASVAISDPAIADLCWIEYSWIRGLRQSAAWMKETPKLYPRVLSVEILPGVTCQLRLQGGTQVVSKSVSSPDTSTKESTQQAPIESAWADVGKDKRLNLLAQMKTELFRVTETMAKLEQEERHQGELFEQRSHVPAPPQPNGERKGSRKPLMKKAPKKAS